MAIHLGRSLPNASRDRPERRRGRPARRRRPKPTPPAAPTWSCSRWGLPCRHRCRRRGALLPHHFTLAARRPEGRNGFGGVFLWHFPWGRPRRALPGTVPPWSPDFPPSPLALDRGEERPSDRLAGIIWDAALLLSNQDRRAGIGHGAVCRTSAIKRRTAGALSPRRHARFNGAISPALRASGR